MVGQIRYNIFVYLPCRGKPQGEEDGNRVFYVIKSTKQPNANFADLGVAAYREMTGLGPYFYLNKLYGINIMGFSNIFGRNGVLIDTGKFDKVSIILIVGLDTDKFIIIYNKLYPALLKIGLIPMNRVAICAESKFLL